MRKSGITITKGEISYVLHNLRVKSTKNSIFSQNDNIYMNSYEDAIDLYRQELAKRIEAYTARTGKKLQKHTIRHLTAIVNLDKHNCTKEYMQKLVEYLEEKLGTKVFNWAIHLDEGWIDEEGNKHINYHAHIEFLGLDEQGNSIRRKLDKKMLRELQTEVAAILDMQRGNYYGKNYRRKRLSTYQYKVHAKRQSEALQEAKKELAKVKDLKELNARMREQLQKAGAARVHYMRLEQYVTVLKKIIKEKELTIEELREKMQKMREDLLGQIEEEHEKNTLLQAEVERLKREIEALRQKRYRERKRTADKLRALRSRLKELQRKGYRGEIDLEIDAIEKQYKQMRAKEAEKSAWRLAAIAQQAFEQGQDELGERAMKLHHRIFDYLNQRKQTYTREGLDLVDKLFLKQLVD